MVEIECYWYIIQLIIVIDTYEDIFWQITSVLSEFQKKVGHFAAESKEDMVTMATTNWNNLFGAIHFPMNIIYKGLQSSQISNVGLASTLTCLYGYISNHYALNLGHCFSVRWDMVGRLVFSYTFDNFFGSFFPIRSRRWWKSAEIDGI